MKTGCLLSFLLLPISLLIWARREQKKRAAMSSTELKQLEAREEYGPVHEELTCIFCHATNCVRARESTERTGSFKHIVSEDNIRMSDVLLCDPIEQFDRMAVRELGRTANFLNAHCMQCGNSWQTFAPDDNTDT